MGLVSCLPISLAMVLTRDALAVPWKGVNLGGWLLLENGPSYPLFEDHVSEKGEPIKCEWDLLQVMQAKFGKKETATIIHRHRETHITKIDLQRIRELGMNAVRLPFGYWVVMAPSASEPYVGPAIEYIDRAVEWAEECGLQVVLDLHGCPGGESGEIPCGRLCSEGQWHWRQWRFKKSLEALEAVARRYKSRRCVTGIAVCNEPSNTVPLQTLCRYYDQAVDTVRGAGMAVEDVTVVLPIYQREEGELIEKWERMTGDRHRNVCFDVHCYHCFENEFHGKTMAGHMRAVEDNAKMLRKYPMVVGEWSLALGCGCWSTCGMMTDQEVYRIFGAAQLKAYEEASHGSFFWNWTEANDVEWNFQMAQRQGFLSGPAMPLPNWDGVGEDPLEEMMHPSPPDAHIRYAEPVYLRVFHGRYIDVEGSQVAARWPDKGKWQELSFWPSANSPARLTAGREVQAGDVVRLRARCGRFFAADGEQATALALPARAATATATEFIVHAEDATELKHRGKIFLEHRATGQVLDADEEEDTISARWSHKGEWQKFAVEKPLAPAPPQTPKKHQQAQQRALSSPTLSSPPQKERRAQLHAATVVGTVGDTPIRRKTSIDLMDTSPKRRRLSRKVAGSPGFEWPCAEKLGAKQSRPTR